MGVFGEEAYSFVSEIGRRLARATGDKRSKEFLVQRISMAVQRGNAAAILGTLPTGRGFGEIFYM